MKIKLKKIIFILILLIPTTTLVAQSGSARVISITDVPEKTAVAFEQAYPEATIKKWWMIEKNYQAEWVKDDRIYKVLINPSGGIIEERKQLIYPNELPEKVLNGFEKTEYKYWNVEEAHVTENTGEDLFYEIKVSKDGRFQIMYFKPNGNIEEKSLSTF